MTDIAAETTENTPETDWSKVERRPRATTNGMTMKLHAPERPGFIRRWVNDDKQRIAEMEALGYRVASEPGLQTFDPGSLTSRLVGMKDGGAPLRTILMETPKPLYEQGQTEKEELIARTDQAIVEQRDPTGELKDGESYSPSPAGHRAIRVSR